MKRKIIQILIPLVIVVLGFVGFKAIMSMKATPKRKKPAKMGLLVRVNEAKLISERAVITGSGEITAEKTIDIVNRTAGKVIYVNPKFKEGGLLKKGDVILKVEQDDYIIALKQAEASLEKSKYTLVKVKSEAEIAKAQWEKWKAMKERLNLKGADKPHPLALYVPQIKDATADVRAKEASVMQAKLNLARTTIKAPFDCVVQTDNVDEGKYIKAGDTVGNIVGREFFEIKVPLTVKQMALLDEETKPEASITVSDGRYKGTWSGTLDRTLKTVNTKGRMTQAVIIIPDPLKPQNGISLSVGMFADVKIKGKTFENIVAIPKIALREGSKVWIAEKGRMKITDVTPMLEQNGMVWITEGLSGGEQVIITPVSGAVDGLKLRVAGQNSGKNKELKKKPVNEG